MSSAPYDLSISAARTGALFASPLQRSDEPSARQIRQAIATAIGAHGVRGCAAHVAQAYGEHPETALTRMRWALTAVASAFGGSRAEPTHAPYLATTPCPAPPVPPHELPPGVPRHATDPLTVIGHGPGCERVGDAHRCSHTSSVSPAARVHHPDMRTEYRNPTT